ncbi:MAG: phosphate ABC transporter substrate-binding protein [Candidatus Margulisiibacteriota bacterium]
MSSIKRYLFLFFAISLLLAGGCARGNKAIQIKGSDTMVNLAEAWTEKFMEKYPESAVAVTGGGSGGGIASLISGTTDIAKASRDMHQKEILLANSRGVYPLELQVASDGVVVVVNPANPINKLTIKELSDIYTGKVRNWRELGGPDRQIVALSRERNSGTHVFFLETVVKLGQKKNPNEFAADVLMMPSSQAVVEEVISNKSAIGYIGLGYLNNRQKALAVGRDKRGPFSLPNISTVKKGEYPISRSLLFYTNGTPEARVQRFIDFVLSPDGQEIVKTMDFVPIK